MFFHIKELQYEAKPMNPDPVFANKLQEALGGQYGEISVMMQYLFQGFNSRADKKYRDLLLDVGTEEIGHVEMLATMIARLLDKAPFEVQKNAYDTDPAIAAVLGGTNPQHAIVSGLGALPADSEGYPWNAKYIISSGNLMADFRANLNAESQGRLQVARLYGMTDDPGVRDMLSFLLARDTYHQNLWYTALKELEERENDIVVPTTFPRKLEKEEVSYTLFNFSRGEESKKGRWAYGPSLDGRGEYNYSQPKAWGKAPKLPPAPPAYHNTPRRDKK